MSLTKVFWFTGQAGAGKTVLAHQLKEELEKKNIDQSIDRKYVIIDGDDIRAIYENKDYSLDGRMANVDFVQKLCLFLIKNKITPIVCMVSPFGEQRKDFINENDGIEIYVYTNEIRGREHYHVEYFEKPDEMRNNVVYIDTTGLTVEESFGVIKNKLI